MLIDEFVNNFLLLISDLMLYKAGIIDISLYLLYIYIFIYAYIYTHNIEMGIPAHLTCLLKNLYAGQEATVGT